MSFLNFVLACLPILWLIFALGVLKMAAHKACLIALAGTAVIAFCGGFAGTEIAATGDIETGVSVPVKSAGTAIHSLTGTQILTASAEGFASALWPICLVIIAALFCYNLCVKTGAMEKIKAMLAGISNDQRVLILLVGWGFGNFMEGMAGFGTAVAIPASMLVAVGVNPLKAVLVCLIGNTTPTAFGSVGVPTATLASITGLDVMSLAKHAAFLQILHTFLSPFLMVFVGAGGFRGLRGAWILSAIAAVSFVFPWAVIAWFLGPELPNIIGAICSMVTVGIFAKIIGTKSGKTESILEIQPPKIDPRKPKISFPEAVRAWCPFIFVALFLMLTSRLCPPIFAALKPFSSSFQIYSGEGANTISFAWANTPGIIIFIAAILGGLVQKATWLQMLSVLAGTLKQYARTVLTICCVMAVAKLMSYSGMIGEIAGTLVAVTGTGFPVISPWIGAVGAFVTGSGTSTSVLFGELQKEAATAIDLAPQWLAAANVFGAGIGKMICPQSIAIGAGAIGLVGSESQILRAAAKYFFVYVALAGAIVGVACWLWA